MNHTEATMLTRYVKACCPQQQIDEYTPDAWFDLLGDLALNDCRTAVIAVSKRQPFVAPAEIRAEVRRVRDDRLANWAEIRPAADPADTKSYLAAYRANLRAVADGYEPPLAIGPGPGVTDPAGQDAVREALRAFIARQDAIREERHAEREEALKAARAHVDATEILLGLPDLGDSYIAAAHEYLFGRDQAAANFPRAAGSLGLNDRAKTLILAAKLAVEDQAPGQAEAS